MSTTMQVLIFLTALAGTSLSTSALASTCRDLPDHAELRRVLLEVDRVDVNDPAGSGGLEILRVWATLVDTSGRVCAVASTEEGDDLSVSAELAHRIFSAHKANTATAFSNLRFGTASGQLYTQALPGGTLYGATLPFLINLSAGDERKFGTAQDPMVGKRVGGFSALAGGLALYNSDKVKVGAIGVSGQSRCTDHLIAWKVRNKLANGAFVNTNVPSGFSPTGTDALVLDVTPDPTGSGGPGHSPSGLGHPTTFCPNLPTREQAGDAILFLAPNLPKR